jgi:hypothetical protein
MFPLQNGLKEGDALTPLFNMTLVSSKYTSRVGIERKTVSGLP